ncbi:Alpha-5 giardin [Giardia muris]|uniref:Alpha-5 giardin n=1 Tax=Giardia muris TaxID=5742 RepID=A0A142C649_GIAMU|nr:alpha-5 giardin [Giardia muris]TNJ30461.1 Alpha-5 giardin [Giardia muris]|eukprot:TNJ30461.1 Alpha-5 giardin [Giardia muris]
MSTIAQLCSDLKSAFDNRDVQHLSFLTSEYSSTSREKISRCYETTYKASIVDLLKKTFEEEDQATIKLLTSMWENRHELRASLLSVSTPTRDTLIDTVMLCSYEDWNAVTEVFNRQYGRILQLDLKGVEPWEQLLLAWTKYQREPMEDGPEQASSKLHDTLHSTDGTTDHKKIVHFFSHVTPDEYPAIATHYCHTYGASIDQDISRLYSDNDLEVFTAAHFALHGLPVLAAFILHRCCAKDGDSTRICHITALMVDQCLAAKYAYRLYGDLGADLARTFPAPLAGLLRTLWRVPPELSI